MAIRKRIGIMVPATNTTVEPDFHRIAPSGVTIHSQRLWIGNADTGQEGMDGMNAQLEEGARHLAQGKVDVGNMTGTTNSFYRDLEWSNEMERVMSRGAGGIPAVATSPSVVRALNYFGAKKISVATPYPDDVSSGHEPRIGCAGDGMSPCALTSSLPSSLPSRRSAGSVWGCR